MRLLDLFAATDQFSLFDNAVLVGTTSVPGGISACGGDIACALADSNYSRGSFNLGAGSHSLTILQDVGTGGAAVFQVNAAGAVPEPGTLGLLGVGLGILGFVRRRKA